MTSIFSNRSSNPSLRKPERSTGFTLIEVLISLTVLMTVVGAAFSVAHFSISDSLYARDQITAFYLAQEVMEYLSNARDNVIIDGDGDLDEDWLDGTKIEECIENGIGCNINTAGRRSEAEEEMCIINDEVDDPCAALMVNDNNDDQEGIYKPQAMQDIGEEWTVSGFERIITIEKTEGHSGGGPHRIDIDSGRLDVTVEVRWPDGKIELYREMTPWSWGLR